MRILHALGWFFPESLGGTEVYVGALASRLSRLGHTVAVTAPLAGADAPQEYEWEGIMVFRYPIPRDLTRSEAQGRIRVRGADAFDQIVRRFEPDITHFHTMLAGLGIDELSAARRLSKSVVATNHLASLGFVCQRGTLMRWGERPCDGVCRPVKCAACELQHRGIPRPLAEMVGVIGHAFRGSAGFLPAGRIATSLLMTDLIYDNQRKQRELLSLVDRYVLLNRNARDMVIANGADPSKLELNYLGTSHVDVPRKASPAQKPTERPIRFGYIGRFSRIKGVFELARAARSLPAHLDFTLELRGPMTDAESKEVVSRLREVAGDDARIQIGGPIPGKDIPRVMAKFDALCVPSIWFENGPTVVFEAQAAGTPVIGTNMGAMPELIRHDVDGLLLEPGDWRALASALQRIVEDPAGTIDRWRNNVPPARTMDTITADYLRIYEAVLDAAATAPSRGNGQ